MKYSINNWDGFRRLWLNRTLSRIERITFWVLPLGLMTVGLVLYRSHLQGFDAQRAILIPAVIMLLGTLTFRSRIAAPIRLQIYCLYLFLLGISGLLTLGLLGLGLIALVFAQAIAALGGVRLWLVFLTLSTLGVVAVGLCFIFGVLELPVDAGEFMRNPMSWGMALLVFQATVFMAILWDKELRWHHRWNSALEKMLEASSTLSGPSPLKSLVAEIGAIAGGDEVAILLRDPTGGQEAPSNWTPHSLWSRTGTPVTPQHVLGGETPWDRVWEEGSYHCSAHLMAKFPALEDARGNGFRSFSGVRLNGLQGTPIGAMAVLQRSENQSPGLLSLLKTLGSRVVSELERQSNLEDLQASENRYHTLFEASNDAIFILDASIILDANSKAEKLFGRSREELLGRSPAEFSPEEQRSGVTSEALVQEGMREAERGERVQFEWKHLRPNGEIFLAEVELHSLDPVNPHIQVGTVRDVTRERETLRALEGALARQKAIFESSPLGIFVVDEERRVTLANQRTAELMACRLEDIIGFDTEVFFRSPEEFQDFGKEYYALLQDRESVSVDLRLKRMDGVAREFVLSGQTMAPQDLAQGTVWTMEDVTEQRALRREKQWLATAMEAAAECVLVMDRQGIIQAVNPGYEEITGYSREESLGRDAAMLRSEYHDEAFFEQLDETIDSGKVWSGRLLSRHKDGGIIYGDATVSPIQDELGSIVGLVCVIRDVTENLKIQQLLVQSEKMLSVGGLAAGMAHEINNPLGGILQGAQNIRRRLLEDLPANRAAATDVGLDPELLRAYLEERKIAELLTGVTDAGERAATIVANMLRFSKPTSGPVQKVDPHTLLERAVDLACIQYDLKKRYDFRNIRIVKDFGEGIPDLLCHPHEIEQVILNLLTNAAQAMVGKEEGSEPLITLRTRAERDHLVIVVEDNGTGIDQENLSRVFEPFFTTKEVGEGTGLGLSVSFFIITQNHRGTMEASSRPGRFTRFTIRLPLGETT